MAENPPRGSTSGRNLQQLTFSRTGLVPPTPTFSIELGDGRGNWTFVSSGTDLDVIDPIATALALSSHKPVRVTTGGKEQFVISRNGG